jgi:hypothetical protein
MKRIFRSSSSLLIHAFPSSVEIDLKGEPQMKQSRPLTNFIVFAMATSILATAYAGQLRAGAARVSITPTADQFPYIIGREKPFVGTHDDVYARALVLDDGATRVAFVVVEAVSVPDPKHVETDVAQAAGVPESNLILCASHTHESLTTFIHGTNLIPSQLEEIEHVRAGAVEAARQAVAHLEPAAIAFGRGEAYVNINNGEQAGLTSWFDPKGPSDKTLDVIRVESASGQPIAMLVSYATHAETMYRSVTKDGGYEVSGDIPGAVSRMLEKNPAGVPVVLFMPPAEADQLGIFKSLQPAVDKLPQADEGAAGWALVDEMARRLTIAVIDTEGKMPPAVSNVTIQAATSTVTCPGRVRPTGPPPGPPAGGQAQGAAGGPPQGESGEPPQGEPAPVVIRLSTVRIGDIAFAGVAGDMGTKIGQEIRAASPVKNTIVISQLAGAVGYIMPDDSYAHPGHGVSGSPLKAGCAEHSIPKGVAALLDGPSK